MAEAALETLTTGAVQVLEFGVSNAQAWDVGLACGGQVTVLLEPLV